MDSLCRFVVENTCKRALKLAIAVEKIILIVLGQAELSVGAAPLLGMLFFHMFRYTIR